MSKSIEDIYPSRATGQALFDGRYSVRKVQSEGEGAVKAAYIVHGPRGQWVLFRNMHEPRHLYVMTVPKAGFPRVSDIRGVEWFVEQADGTLQPAV